ncbi:MAG TPA: hypothetical protein VHB20_00875 [Verrucomicrobiae bacterium]|jgi:hypothetical protein|nr:hypothetical protein [Verrucomicrobiae bacterium]
MNTRKRPVKTRFGPEARFEVHPIVPAAPFRGTQETELDRLKTRLLRELLADTEPGLNAPLRRAANEAASLAWVTPFPLLFFPTLLEEKARTAQQQQARQRRIRQRTLALVEEAAA